MSGERGFTSRPGLHAMCQFVLTVNFILFTIITGQRHPTTNLLDLNLVNTQYKEDLDT